MGRNGKSAPAFPKMVIFINANVGREVVANEILLGKAPGRNSETSYLYRILKLGYAKILDNKNVMDPKAKYKILKRFPENYNSVALMAEGKKLKK